MISAVSSHKLSTALANVRRAANLARLPKHTTRGELLTLRTTLEAVKSDADRAQRLVDQALGPESRT